MKKAIDLVIEKHPGLLPDPYNIELIAGSEEIPDPLENMSKTAGPAVRLGEGEGLVSHFMSSSISRLKWMSS